MDPKYAPKLFRFYNEDLFFCLHLCLGVKTVTSAENSTNCGEDLFLWSSSEREENFNQIATAFRMRRVTVAEAPPPPRNILQFKCLEQPHKQVSDDFEKLFFCVYFSREWGSCCL